MANVQVKVPNVAGVAAPGNAPKPTPPKSGLSTVTISSAAYRGYDVTINKHDQVVLLPANKVDPIQHWTKDNRWGNAIRDAEGRPAFALVNSVTQQAIKRPHGESQPVTLVPYNPAVPDRSVLWTEKEVGQGFYSIRELDNIELVFDAVPRGTEVIVIVSKYKGTDSQKWDVKQDKL
ncbi:hypothetical protein ACP70R_040012 [Stipagrostis hirtigluma subsp. patula]